MFNKLHLTLANHWDSSWHNQFGEQRRLIGRFVKAYFFEMGQYHLAQFYRKIGPVMKSSVWHKPPDKSSSPRSDWVGQKPPPKPHHGRTRFLPLVGTPTSPALSIYKYKIYISIYLLKSINFNIIQHFSAAWYLDSFIKLDLLMVQSIYNRITIEQSKYIL